MKTRKLIKKLGAFLDRDQNLATKELQSIREVLSKLKEKEQKYTALLKTEQDPAKLARLEEKRNVAHAQRTKGVERLRELLGKKPSVT